MIIEVKKVESIHVKLCVIKNGDFFLSLRKYPENSFNYTRKNMLNIKILDEVKEKKSNFT